MKKHDAMYQGLIKPTIWLSISTKGNAFYMLCINGEKYKY